MFGYTREELLNQPIEIRGISKRIAVLLLGGAQIKATLAPPLCWHQPSMALGDGNYAYL
jgi:hypothetical protein